MLRKIILSACSIFTAAIMGVCAFAATTPNAKSTVSVSGTGVVMAKPDIAYFSAGVTTSDKNAKVAQEKNTAQILSIISALKKAGVKESNISTGYINIYPEYDYEKDRELKGYRVNNTLSITVENINDVGKLVNVALDAGANNLDSLDFNIKNQKAMYQKALQLAIKDAKIRANTIAGATEKKLGDIIYVTEGGNNYSYMNNAYEEKIMPASDASGVGDTISSDLIKVSATVKVEYELED